MGEDKPIRLRVVINGAKPGDFEAWSKAFERAAQQAGARAAKQMQQAAASGVKAKLIPNDAQRSAARAAALSNLPAGAKVIPSRYDLTPDYFRKLARESAAADKSLSKVPRSIGNTRNAMLTLASTFYVMRTMGSIIEHSLVAPIQRLSRAFISADENRRKFTYAISGVAGMARAREIERSLAHATRAIPVPLSDVRDSARALTFIPALAERMGTGSPADASKEALRFAQLARRLGMIDPQQGTSGGVIALRELAEGDAISLRRRFGFDLRQIARSIGRDERELKNDPALAFKGVERLAEVLLPDEAMNRASQLISTRVQKLRDAMEDALADVGDSGVFDSTVARLERTGLQVFNYLDSPKWRATTRRISGDLDRTIGNVGGALEQLLRKLTGTKADTSTVSGVGDAIADTIDRIARLSENLPSIFEKVGAMMGAVAGKISAFIDSVIFIADSARNPGAYIQNLANSALTPEHTTGQRVGGGNVNERMLDILRRVGIDPGLVGTTAYDPRTTSEHVYAEGKGFVSATFQATLQSLREAVGSDALVEQLSFDRLPASQRLHALQAYEALRDTGSVPPALLAKLANVGTARAWKDDPANFGPISDIIKSELSTPNYGTPLAAQGAALGRLADLSPQTEALQRLSDAAGGALKSDVFSKLASQRDEALLKIDAALVDAKAKLATSDSAELRQQMQQVEELRSDVVSRFGSAVDLATENLISGASNYTRALAQAMNNVPLSGDFQRKLADGATAYADRIATAAGGARGRIGIDSFPLNEAQLFTQQLSQQRGADAELYGRVGFVSPGMTGEQIMAAYGRRPDSTGVARLQLAALQNEGLPMQARVLERANLSLASNPGDPLAIRDSGKAVAAYAELVVKLHELKRAADPLTAAFVNFGYTARDALEGGLGEAINGLIAGTSTLRDVLVGFAGDITQAFSRMLANQFLVSLIGNFGTADKDGNPNPIGGLFGRMFSGKAYADGGIVRSPTLALIGEGRHNEAVVPMPDGRSVPLAMRGSSLYAALPGGRFIPTTLRTYADGGVMPGRFVSPGALRSPAPSVGRGVEQSLNIILVHDMAEALRRKTSRDVILGTVGKNISGGGTLKRAIRSR